MRFLSLGLQGPERTPLRGAPRRAMSRGNVHRHRYRNGTGVAGLAVTAAALASLIVPGVAIGGHAHTTGRWYHGLGDSMAINGHLHPFNDRTNGAWVKSTTCLYRNGTAYRCKTDWDSHAHFDWSFTYAQTERRYYSSHWAVDMSPSHIHFHHYYICC